MKTKFNLLIIILLVNLIYFAHTSSHFDTNNYEEGSGFDTDLTSLNNPLNPSSNHGQNVLLLEEKIKYLTETFNQLDLKMNNLINANMDLLENKFQKIMDDKLIHLNQIEEEKINLLTNNNPSYNVQEVKCSDNRLPKSCGDLNECNSNVYSIMLPEFSNKSFPAVCDLKTLEGGWTIIQRRQDGSENYYRNWTDYVEGFGDLNGEFFIGLEKLYALTSLDEPQELYIILEDFEGERRYANYNEFKVDSKTTDYMLTVDEYSGDADDCFSQHSGQKFSTPDRDNDSDSTQNCAEDCEGAWWYKDVYYSHLNGRYLSGKISKSEHGVSWCGFRDLDYSLKFVQMMIRPKKN